jgi:hypothetical protein
VFFGAFAALFAGKQSPGYFEIASLAEVRSLAMTQGCMTASVISDRRALALWNYSQGHRLWEREGRY